MRGDLIHCASSFQRILGALDFQICFLLQRIRQQDSNTYGSKTAGCGVEGRYKLIDVACRLNGMVALNFNVISPALLHQTMLKETPRATWNDELVDLRTNGALKFGSSPAGKPVSGRLSPHHRTRVAMNPIVEKSM